ncbi:methylmalonyl-CoA mutase family protein [Sporosarcina sp. ACRSL]|uniref:methylmalonyl-CoA mutase family protein n=1 Tax=Sporosarcina sp. ACRSL TaxID=2918215 RepID=UPI001EF42AEE|nr:methylmalonyl-CoA mutase family protein [Sporosarcina sp. ACRSL]MCG7346561.1 methylmalonyl-CoA mutase family protein [Sporosarcina sp. ACRSL]
MAVDSMKNTTFEKVEFEQWKNLAIASLKGKPYESLTTATIEGIELQPLYYQTGKLDSSSVVQSMKRTVGWTIAQQTIANDGSEFLERLQESIEKGNESIVYDGNQPLDWNDDQLLQLSTFIAKYPVFFFNVTIDDPILRAFDFVHHEVRENVSGIIQVSDWTIPVGYKNIRTEGVDLWQVHHEGADAVTELAIALSEASRIASGYESFQEFADNFFVRFPIDTHFFMEIAKLRAFRALWKAFTQAYDVDEPPYLPVLAVTSLRSFSKLDPYVNMLRAGNETFAAILGGADIIQAHPHNIVTGPNASSIRHSRNMQLVLKEETHVEKVLDPAGGSFFIETLTEELIEAAWKLFLDIESKGGITYFNESGKLQEQLSRRQTEVATGKKSLIGTNVYAELNSTNFDDWKGIERVKRLAEPFETLRKMTSESQPKTTILTFGKLKDFKLRADFVTGFLASGGIRSNWSPAFENVEQAVKWLKQDKPDYIIVCGTDEIVKGVMDPLLEQLPAGILLDVAGKIEEETYSKWKQKGLNGMIFNGQNKIEKLQSIVDSWQGGLHK